MSYRNLLPMLVVFSLNLLLGAAFAQTESPLYNFTGGSDGAAPWGLVSAKSGSFYGTTGGGGALFGGNGFGTIFELTKGGTERVLWTFGGPPNDGDGPVGGMTKDSLGNLYGTTIFGGTANEGIVFEVSPTSRTEQVLYNFTGSALVSLRGNAVLDKSGNLYGTALASNNKPPSIYRLNLGTHAVSIVYSFGLNINGNPVNARDDLAIDGSGSLYGTTYAGGKYALGSVFKVTPAGVYKDIYSFTGGPTDGGGPSGGVVFYKGNLYGTTFNGGSNGNGVVYKVSLKGVESVLYNFPSGNTTDQADGELSFDGVGNIYGTTGGVGGPTPGSVFALSPTGTGTYTLLWSYTFKGGTTDGASPEPQRLVVDSKHNVYGTTHVGGTFGWGTVFKATP